MKNTSKLLALLLALGLSTQAHATVIAIIDSGTDLSHPDLVNKKWFNPGEGNADDAVDNDNNGYIDDINGWNFADNNNKLYDKSYLGTFSPDTYKFFEVQTRLLRGTGTADDLAWIRQKQQDQNFIAGLEVFANFVHGSHVAGISSRNADKAELMILKIIPTKAPTIGGGHQAEKISIFKGVADTLNRNAGASAGFKDMIIKEGLTLLASQQGKGLAPIGQYVLEKKARVANCSFGTSTTAAQTILGPLLKMVLRRDPTPDELATYSAYFVQQITNVTQGNLLKSQGTLFVIAAGNDGTDNDALPTSPANVKADNTIAVAATLDYTKLASFSNYGATKVEVAAPGVGIRSTIPGDQYLTVSGTSQAAPYVTNVAGLALDANPSLSNTDLKQIIMSTVDMKEFLTGKVVSGGIVNTGRAVLAAHLATTMQIADAISAARVQVGDVNPVPTIQSFETGVEYEGYVLPLPSLFY